jgi:hypothetical protein
MPHSIKIRDIAPPDLATAPTELRQAFWQLVVPIALRVKDQELAAGLDAEGDPLRPISDRTRKYRRSAMTPDGKGDPAAPPLMPAYQKSRVRSLLAARAFATHCELYWRYDPFSGRSFDVILNYQREQGRDVFGISDDGMRAIRIQSWAAWTRFKNSGAAPVEKRTAFPSYALTQGPQPRIAGIIARSAEPGAGARTSVAIGNLDTRFITRGPGVPKIKDLKASATRSGSMGREGWHRYYTEEIGKPPRPRAAVPRAPIAPRPPAPAPPAPTHANPLVQDFLTITHAAKVPVRVIDDRAEAEKRWKWLVDFLPSSYNWADNTIYVNPHALHWTDPAGFAAMDEVGWFSGNDAAHAAHHEIGHYRHAQAITPGVFGDWVSLKPSDVEAIASEVSGYAATNRVEFVAEVYAGLKGGKVYSPAIMALYRRYKGPTP